MESEPMLTPKEKKTLPGKKSSGEDRTRDAASSRTASPTHYQPAIPAPNDKQLALVAVAVNVIIRH